MGRTHAKESFGDILKKERLQFKNNAQLKAYYSQKYKEGGYKGGYTLWGINLSNIYHKDRINTSLKFLEPRKNEIILDAGCGNGALALMASKKCKEMYAIDITKNAFLKNKKFAPKNLHFLESNIENLPFKKNTFDKIVCVETLEHVISPEKVLNELFRVLKPNGKLVLTYPTINKTIIAKMEQSVKLRKPLQISEHLTEWDYNEVIDRANRAGFRLLRTEGIAFNFGRIGKLEKLSKKIFKFHYKLSLAIRIFPRNSSFVAFAFIKSE